MTGLLVAVLEPGCKTPVGIGLAAFIEPDPDPLEPEPDPIEPEPDPIEPGPIEPEPVEPEFVERPVPIFIIAELFIFAPIAAAFDRHAYEPPDDLPYWALPLL
ncbi:MAG: hypothetical protein ABR591_05245 [Candidatus Velthaea sp.]